MTIQACIDRHLPPELTAEAHERAVAENPLNALLSLRGQRGQAPRTPEEIIRRLGDSNGPARLALLTANKWANGRRLLVGFTDGDPVVQAKVRHHAEVWSQFANITFEWVNPADAEIRISFRHRGSWSYLGTDALSIRKPDPTMNYGWLTPTMAEEEYRRVVVHEFGHALGAVHEHQSPAAEIPWNREAVYAYYARQGWSRADVDANLFARYAAGQTNFSAYDPRSIMIYAIPREHVTDPAAAVGWNTDLSETDKTFVGSIYPKPAPPGPAEVTAEQALHEIWRVSLLSQQKAAMVQPEQETIRRMVGILAAHVLR